jgi:hypothetical protein
MGHMPHITCAPRPVKRPATIAVPVRPWTTAAWWADRGECAAHTGVTGGLRPWDRRVSVCATPVGCTTICPVWSGKS